jgi:hypothetical protein
VYVCVCCVLLGKTVWRFLGGGVVCCIEAIEIGIFFKWLSQSVLLTLMFLDDLISYPMSIVWNITSGLTRRGATRRSIRFPAISRSRGRRYSRAHTRLGSRRRRPSTNRSRCAAPLACLS